MDDKIIVTHREALKGKYGTKGFAKIRAALTALIAADKKRGFKTRVVYLDDAAAMKRLRAKALVDNTNCRAAKDAIDGVFKKLKPDYLMILGAPDVVPHQDLKNPAYNLPNDEGDDDLEALGDLPYACDTPYHRDTAKFIGPTRVVGRLPDLTGATEPSHLLSLLKTAATWKSRDPGEYARHFGLSTFTWHRSTRRSLEDIFGSDDRLLISPPRGPGYPRGELRVRAHFINCHGGEGAPRFEGQKGSQYPGALTARATRRNILEGTVASVECCYGAQLYDSVTLGIDMPICQSYLRQGAYGWLGSTTVAYGSDGKGSPNASADVLCTHFLQNVLEGASIGRAALMARQQFAEECDQADPIDLKTLAQFCLYGDPSVHPVARKDASPAPKGVKAETVGRFRRNQRRAKLRETGEFLTATKPTASKQQKGVRMSAQSRSALARIARKGGLKRSQCFAAYAVKGGTPARGRLAKAGSAPSRYYLAIGRPKAHRRYRVAVIAKELNGQVVDYRIYEER